MKKKTFIIALIVSIVFLSVTTVVFFKNITDKFDQNGNNSTAASLYEGWKVGAYEEKIALYKGNEKKPVNVFDTHVSSLREYDRTLILNGFYTDDYDTAMKYIEELTS